MVIAKVTSREGAIKPKELTPDTVSFRSREKWKVMGALKPAPRD
jgi:hypothetical protein